MSSHGILCFFRRRFPRSSDGTGQAGGSAAASSAMRTVPGLPGFGFLSPFMSPMVCTSECWLEDVGSVMEVYSLDSQKKMIQNGSTYVDVF